MEFHKYNRKPFSVDAVQITEENIAEMADLLGELKSNADGQYIIIAMNRRIVPNITRAFVGWWVTKVNDGYRCYSNKVFTNQFELANPMTVFPLGADPYVVDV